MPSITRRFKATGPILIDVSTVKRYAQAGCARLRCRSHRTESTAWTGAPRRNTVDFGINYCRDGQPPKSLT
jgi:elongation factor P hydroxylase